jgi:hypothetical protein
MTELYEPDTLLQIARVLDEPTEQAARPVAVLQWSANPVTGRPESRWMIKPDQKSLT